MKWREKWWMMEQETDAVSLHPDITHFWIRMCFERDSAHLFGTDRQLNWTYDLLLLLPPTASLSQTLLCTLISLDHRSSVPAQKETGFNLISICHRNFSHNMPHWTDDTFFKHGRKHLWSSMSHILLALAQHSLFQVMCCLCRHTAERVMLV